MSYNMTSLTETETVGALIQWADAASGFTLVSGFVIAFWVVSFFVLKKYRFEYAALSSSFSSFIISMVLLIGGFVSFMIPLFFLILMALLGLYSVMTDK